MKKLLLLMLLSTTVLADPDSPMGQQSTDSMSQYSSQDNQATNAPTSVMSNTQVNAGVTHDSFGGGVSCARTTWQAGGVGHTNSPYQTGVQLYIGITGTFGDGGRCEDAAAAQLYLNRMRHTDLKESLRRRTLTHNQEIKKQKLLYADLLAKVCENHHSKVAALEGSFMDSQCDTYKTISHHKPDYDETKYHRVSGH